MDRLNRVEIELRAAETRLARVATDRVSAMWKDRIAPMIASVCHDVVPGDALCAIDTLELELGTIPAEQLEEVFVARFEQALRTALAKAIARRRRADDRGASALKLLELYARTGNLPWWATASATLETIAARFAIALRDAEPALVRLVQQLAPDTLALNRLARACAAGEARSALEELAARHAPTATGTSREGATARDLLRSIAMPGAAADRVTAPRGTADPASGAATKDAVLLKAERRNAVASVAAGVAEPASRSPEAEATRKSATARAAGEASATHEASAAREASGHARVVGNDHHHVVPDDDAQRAPSAGDRRSATATSMTSPEHREIRNPAVERSVVRRGESIRAARRAALVRVDELYIDNAGLVILWPFVERLFVRAGLVGEDRAFVGPPAREQAVALLDALATGQLEPFEPRLPLAKLLCGLQLDGDFELEAPLAPELLAEGERMLLAVIDRARSFGELTVEAFRTEFLQRQGALTTRDGAWLLRVERRASDVVLDHLPWPWTWISLPWMLDPLRVEW